MIKRSKCKEYRRFMSPGGAPGGIALTGMLGTSVGDSLAQTTPKVSQMGSPSSLKITDLSHSTTSNGTGAPTPAT